MSLLGLEAGRLDNRAPAAEIGLLERGQSCVAVIPVLVDGARMPAADALPARLKPLARRKAT